MIGWPVIGLLSMKMDRLPGADHDGGSGVFSTEKRRGCALLWLLALRLAPPAPSPLGSMP